jgi:uncharacterized membrane protein
MARVMECAINGVTTALIVPLVWPKRTAAVLGAVTVLMVYATVGRLTRPAVPPPPPRIARYQSEVAADDAARRTKVTKPSEPNSRLHGLFDLIADPHDSHSENLP